MSEEWRYFLYPLGYLATIAFASRMIIQWMLSELQGKSVVTPLFWRISMIGNISLAIHGFIQAQFHVCLVQMCSVVIAWRNLNLMQPTSRHVSTITTISLLLMSIAATMGIFAYFIPLSSGGINDWFRAPSILWKNEVGTTISFWWHVLGCVGLAVFGCRFWLQWFFAERRKESYFGAPFWWVSLAGESICLVYFLRIGDPVNFIGPMCGVIPCIRNLILIYQPRSLLEEK